VSIILLCLSDIKKVQIGFFLCLQQLMAGARKFALPHLERRDLMALTREAAEVSGIPYVMDADRDEVGRILGG